ncbi:hypothetical protein GCM10029978_107550 [Actinoallomurus acanthiterrae]
MERLRAATGPTGGVRRVSASLAGPEAPTRARAWLTNPLSGYPDDARYEQDLSGTR